MSQGDYYYTIFIRTLCSPGPTQPAYFCGGAALVAVDIPKYYKPKDCQHPSKVYVYTAGTFINSNWVLVFCPKTNRKNLPIPILAQNWAQFAFLDY